MDQAETLQFVYAYLQTGNLISQKIDALRVVQGKVAFLLDISNRLQVKIEGTEGEICALCVLNKIAFLLS